MEDKSLKEKARMTELTPEVLEELQKVQIEILEEIERICEKYDLRYFLAFGTLLGAIRHKGFIPWDDDLDIGMPRDDYEKFMEVAKDELDERFFLQNMETQPGYWLTFAKVRKNHTLFEEPSLAKMEEGIHKGIFVDIFPHDYVKKNSGLFLRIQFILSKAIIETLYYKAGVYSKSMLRYGLLDSLLNLFSMRILGCVQEKIIKLQSGKDAKYLADFQTTGNYLDAVFPEEWFYPLQDGEFAGKSFKIPKEWDAYLRANYGDYMVLPKEEDRVNHRTLRIIFDTRK